MRRIAGLLLLPFALWAVQPVQIKTEILFSGEPATALKSIHRGFAQLGYRLDINAVSVNGPGGEVHGSATGIKPFNAELFRETLAETGVRIGTVAVEHGVLRVTADAEGGVWNAPLLGRDEGIELAKTTVSQWFRVEENQVIRIHPPYVGKWYPEIAVLNSSMEVLYSYRSAKAQEEIELPLPPAAAYLKVSNTNGMKLLKEGMWIESISSGN